MNAHGRPQTVEGYLANLDETKAATLRATIATILGQFADLQVVIAWNVPQIKRGHEVHLWALRLQAAPRAALEDYRVQSTEYRLRILKA